MTWELHNAKNNTWNAIHFRFYRLCCESVGVVVVVVVANGMLFCISSHHIKSNWKSHNFNVHKIPFYLVCSHSFHFVCTQIVFDRKGDVYSQVFFIFRFSFHSIVMVSFQENESRTHSLRAEENRRRIFMCKIRLIRCRELNANSYWILLNLLWNSELNISVKVTAARNVFPFTIETVSQHFSFCLLLHMHCAWVNFIKYFWLSQLQVLTLSIFTTLDQVNIKKKVFFQCQCTLKKVNDTDKAYESKAAIHR